jgi:hypothetical protein
VAVAPQGKRHARGNRALNRSDLDAAFATLPSDIEWHVIEDIAKLAGVPPVLWGREAVFQLFERILEVVSWSVEIAVAVNRSRFPCPQIA